MEEFKTRARCKVSRWILPRSTSPQPLTFATRTMPLMSTILDCIIQPVFSSSHSTLTINGLVRHLSVSFAKKRTVDQPFELGTHYFLIQQHSDHTRWILSMKLRGLSFHAKRCSGKWCRVRNYISRKRPEGNARASRMRSPLITSG